VYATIFLYNQNKRGEIMKKRGLMRNLSTIFRHRRRAIRRHLERYDIGSGEWSILTLLEHNGNGVEQTEIGSELGLEKTTAARELKSLEKKGYVVRKQDETDKRKKIVYTTEKAAETTPLIKDAGDKWLRRIQSY
jgi:DNA-binding MarR family transcriptional regulator